MKSSFRIVLWIIGAALGIFGLLTASGLFETSGVDPAGRGILQALGLLLCMVAAGGAGALLLARRWRGWLWVALFILVLPFLLVAVVTIWSAIDSAHQQRVMADMHSGRADFGEHPALLAVAEAISRNDEAAIRAAAKAVPDLQAAGSEGKTLLYFAVDEALERPELIKAVEVLLSLGADPNYHNGELASFALWRAVSGEVRLLRALLDAGGNPNGRDFRNHPIVFANWELTFHEADRPNRLRLLLDRGADINSTLSDDSPSFGGYTLLLFRTNFGRGEPSAYADALELLKRGADYNRPAQDGTTLAKMLIEHRASFASDSGGPPPEYLALCDWLKSRGVEL